MRPTLQELRYDVLSDDLKRDRVVVPCPKMYIMLQAAFCTGIILHLLGLMQVSALKSICQAVAW